MQSGIKKFFRKYSEGVLIFLAAVFLAIIVFFFYDTIEVVVQQVASAIVSSPVSSGIGFDLSDSATINFRGMIATSSVDGAVEPVFVPVQGVPPPVVTPPAATTTATSTVPTGAASTTPAATTTE